jgi:hypothetical protein
MQMCELGCRWINGHFIFTVHDPYMALPICQGMNHKVVMKALRRWMEALDVPYLYLKIDKEIVYVSA